MSDERLARMETHLEYIRAAITGWDDKCANHRKDRDEKSAQIRAGAEFALFLRSVLSMSAKLIAIVGVVAGIVKAALALQ